MRFFITLFICCIVNGKIYAEDCFKLSQSVPQQRQICEMEFNTSGAIAPFSIKNAITGFSISGEIKKTSADYFVRVVLKDSKGIEYLVLESYEELNNNEHFQFTNYCEETGLLDYVTPDSLKIYLKDAELRISDFCTTESLEKSSASLLQECTNRRNAQVCAIINRINNYNITNRRLWIAGETKMSKLSYETRKQYFDYDNNSICGLEYYIGGIFEVGHNAINPELPKSSQFADSFDWRNWQGRNWMTPIKNQSVFQFCTAFAASACIEALVNLYYNRKIDLNLSVMQIACCSDTIPHLYNQPLVPLKVVNYLSTHSLCDSISYPLILTMNPQCQIDNITPNELVGIFGYEWSSVTDNVKQKLIKYGPLMGNVKSSVLGHHEMALVGYNKVIANDSNVLFEVSESSHDSVYSLPSTDPRIGMTYWIFKNSWGDLLTSDGYLNILFKNTNGMIPNGSTYYAFKTPITTLNYSDDDVVIEDLDGDGFYNWGIGTKPSSCPVWIPDQKDGDDTDPTKYYMNDYGNFPNTYSFPLGTEYVTNDMTIDSNVFLSSNLDVYHGVTLTITGSAYCLQDVKIIINGGTVIVDGGVLANAKIEYITPCSIIVRNGGKIYMKKDEDFVAPVGCTVEISNGEILGPYRKG